MPNPGQSESYQRATVNKQQNQLSLIEEEKNNIKNEFFKQNKKIIRKRKDIVEETLN